MFLCFKHILIRWLAGYSIVNTYAFHWSIGSKNVAWANSNPQIWRHNFQLKLGNKSLGQSEFKAVLKSVELSHGWKVRSHRRYNIHTYIHTYRIYIAWWLLVMPLPYYTMMIIFCQADVMCDKYARSCVCVCVCVGVQDVKTFHVANNRINHYSFLHLQVSPNITQHHTTSLVNSSLISRAWTCLKVRIHTNESLYRIYILPFLFCCYYNFYCLSPRLITSHPTTHAKYCGNLQRAFEQGHCITDIDLVPNLHHIIIIIIIIIMYYLVITWHSSLLYHLTLTVSNPLPAPPRVRMTWASWAARNSPEQSRTPASPNSIWRSDRLGPFCYSGTIYYILYILYYIMHRLLWFSRALLRQIATT